MEYNRIPNVFCSVCDKPFYKRPNEIKKLNGIVYCSTKCFGFSCRKESPCVVCNKPIIASKHAKTCSRACSNKNRTGIKYKTDNYLIRGYRKDKAKTNLAIKHWLVSIRGHKCQSCSYDKFLIVHHVIEKAKGGSNDEYNVLLICSNCHMEIHKNIDGPALNLQKETLWKMNQTGVLDSP